MPINIELHASSAIDAALYGRKIEIDGAEFFDELRNDAQEHVASEVDNACTYYADCLDIISRYESEYGDEYEETGETFLAADWRQAMTRYAACIADAAISAELARQIDNMAEAYETLMETVNADDVSATMGHDCPHGWAAHAEETPEGVCVWHRLEGELEARAICVDGWWISATWTPAAAGVEG